MPFTIVTQPVALVNAAYNEIYYQFRVTNPVTDPTTALEFDYLNQAVVLIAAVPYSPNLIESAGGGFNNEFYDLDVSGVCQELFDNKLFIPDSAPGLDTLKTDDELRINLIMDGYEWRANADDLLEREGTPTSTADIIVLNAWINKLAGQQMQDYVPTSSSKKFLTNAPLRQMVGYDMSAYLYYFSQGSERIRIETVGHDGLTQIITETVNADTNTIGVVGIGPANLLANATIQGDIIQDDGGGWRLDENVKYYDVWLVNGSGTQLTQKRRYYLDPLEDCVKYRIHFLNQVGGFDALSVYNVVNEDYRVQSRAFQNSLPYLAVDGSDSDAELGRLYAVGEPAFKVEIENVREDHMIWLRELQKSTLIMLEKDGLWIPVYGKRPKSKITSKTQNKFEMEFFYSNREFAQIG